MLSQLQYLLVDTGLPHSSHRHFHVNRSSGALTVAKPLDFELAQVLRVDVVVKDCGHYPLQQQTSVVIVVTDVNDNAPVIRLHPHHHGSGSRHYDNQLQVLEHARPGTLIAHLSVHDRDSADNGRVSCFLGGHDVGGLFRLHRLHHGQYALTVSGARRLDHDRRTRYQVTLTCSDHGQPSAVTTVTLSIVDVEGHATRSR